MFAVQAICNCKEEFEFYELHCAPTDLVNGPMVFQCKLVLCELYSEDVQETDDLAELEELEEVEVVEDGQKGGVVDDWDEEEEEESIPPPWF